jgi:hypothetical protein
MVQKCPLLPFMTFSQTKIMKTNCFFLIMLHLPPLKVNSGIFQRIIMMKKHNPLRLNTF